MYKIAILFLGSVLFLVSCARDDAGGASDLRALDAAYVSAWKNEDAAAQREAVMALFASDAVIMPDGGAEPKRGKNAISAFWFSDDTPATKVIEFTHSIDSIETENDLGVIRGRFSLEFEYGSQRVKEEGNFQIVARRGPEGKWKIGQFIWNSRTAGV